MHTKTGDKVLDTQRGVVTSVNAGSVTVKSKDGFSATYTLNPATKVHKGKQTATHRPDHHQRPGTDTGQQDRHHRHRHPHRRRRARQVTHHQVCRPGTKRFRVRHTRAVRGNPGASLPVAC